MQKIAVIEDTKSLGEALIAVLAENGFAPQLFSSAEQGLKAIKESCFSLVLSDLKLPGLSGLDFVKLAKKEQPHLPIVVMTAFGSIDIAVQAMKFGAVDFITKPFDPSTMCDLIKNIAESANTISLENSDNPPEQFLTIDEKTSIVLEQAKKVAPLKCPVLVTGESGTGKELIARYIHSHSQRCNYPFIPISCGSVPAEILESELFGHEEGAFTGASSKHIGLFESAHGGTLFLDEVGNMSHALQMKLLRVLQDEEIRPLGANQTKKVDVRIISATNCNIRDALQNNQLRHDLYYRLSVIVLNIPPLRERKEDIEFLANYFSKTVSLKQGKTPLPLSEYTMNNLRNMMWSGNVRELKNLIEQAIIFSKHDSADKFLEVTPFIREATREILKMSDRVNAAAKREENESIRLALIKVNGNKSKAAKLLGISYKTLLNKLKNM